MKNSKINEEIIFYGPVRGKNNRVGGGEAGNERTIMLLKEQLGCKVRVISKTYGKDSGSINFLQYLLGTGINILLTTILLILSWKKKVLHISGFYGKSVYIELIFTLIGSITAKKTIYEIRAGGAEEYYNTKGKTYRWAFKKILLTADSALSQGKSQIKFLKQIAPNLNVVYYPNFVTNTEISSEKFKSNNDNELRIVYFGRIAPEKGLKIILDTIKKLPQTTSLELIGAISKTYEVELTQSINENKLEERVKIIKPMQQLELKDRLEKFHFFLFPTKEPREGHSNALNEAMAKGVVPLASNWGFNSDVIGDNELIINNVTADEFYQRISHIWNNKKWTEKSKFVRNRVTTLFSENSARKSLIAAYQG